MLAASGLLAKCVVLDLDNTLWGGVIGDDGLEGIALGEFDEGEAFVSFQKFIHELKRRGVILAVVSKNEHSIAIVPFREHPHMALKEEDISVFVANWDNKADNIRLVQKALNICFFLIPWYSLTIIHLSVTSCANFCHRLSCRNTCSMTPRVESSDPRRTQPVRDGVLLGSRPPARGSISRREAQRELVKQSFTNVNDYLNSLGMEVRLERFNAFNLPRIAQGD